MTRTELVQHIRSKKNYLCVGLDTDVSLLPNHLPKTADAVLAFNKAIIDSTAPYCVSYKINTAFYEAMGVEGWRVMQETLAHIPATHFTIADAKRGDIGNTAAQYAKAFFETLPFHAITVAPYMGADSVQPFLQYKDKWTILLGLTSNKSAADFELLTVQKTEHHLDEGVHVQRQTQSLLYEEVMKKARDWAGPDQLMFVVGATQPQALTDLRKAYPDYFLLVPGVGAQGGSLADVSKAALTADGGLLVNVSRAILYASEDEDFATEAAAIAQQYAQEMRELFEWSSA